MIIKEINDKEEKIEILESILKFLLDWFGIQESKQDFICASSDLPFFAAIDESRPLGFIAIKENNPYTAEIYIMGVIPDYHRQGIGRALIDSVISWAKEREYEFLQVKTLDESHPDPYYARTRKFYRSVGFKPLECLPELWGRENPCLIMIQHIS